MNDTILTAVLSDLWKIRGWCINPNPRLAPASVVSYLVENNDLLRWYTHHLYSTTTKPERETLLSEHRELDESIIYGDSSSYIDALLDSVRLHASGLVEITDDDINMLIRPLEYVKYLPAPTVYHEFSLSLSPIRLPT